MSEPNEIRAGDSVRQRDTEDEGNVVELLPFWGGFAGGPDRVLLTVAIVRWAGTGRRTVVRVDDLIKLS